MERRLADLARKHPALFPFGLDEPRRLTREEEATASLEDRLRSVWPYIVRKCVRFCGRLKVRERATLSVEDAVNEVAAALAEKDSRFDPAKGRYITFAEWVAKSVLATGREKSRIVNSSNTLGRLRRYRAKGELDRDQRAVVESLERTLEPVDSIVGDHTPGRGHDTVPDAIAAREDALREHDLLLQAFRGMDAMEAMVLARIYGIGPADPLTPAEVGRAISMSSAAVRQLEVRAKANLKARIESLRNKTK